MKVLFLVPYPLEGASYRYRIHQFLPYLQKENISYKVSSFISQDFYKILYKKGYLLKKLFFTLLGLQRRFIDILSLYTYDVIFIHLESSPLPILLLERMAQVLKKPIIYDFDDAIFLEKENSTNILRTILKAYKKTPQRIALSSKIIEIVFGTVPIVDKTIHFSMFFIIFAIGIAIAPYIVSMLVFFTASKKN